MTKQTTREAWKTLWWLVRTETQRFLMNIILCPFGYHVPKGWLK